MFDTLKNSLTTTAGWVAMLQMVSQGFMYFLPPADDTILQAFMSPLSAAIIAGGALFHMFKAGLTTPSAATTTPKS